MLGWKTHNNIMKPTNSPTQGQPNPRKIRLKVALGPLFPTANYISWVGIDFIQETGYKKPNPINFSRKNPNQPTNQPTNQSFDRPSCLKIRTLRWTSTTSSLSFRAVRTTTASTGSSFILARRRGDKIKGKKEEQKKKWRGKKGKKIGGNGGKKRGYMWKV